MGKEAKIGLTVIGLLLVVFGLVLVSRLMKGHDDCVASNSPETSKSEEPSKDKDKDAGKCGTTPDCKHAGSKKDTKGNTKSKTTVVPAKTVSKQTPAYSTSRWSVPTKSPSKTAGKTPSYMPNPTTARYHSPNNKYAGQSAASQSQQSRQDGVPRSNPFRRGQASGVAQTGQTPSQLTVLSPPPRHSAQQSVQQTGRGYGSDSRYARPTGGYQPRHQPHAHAPAGQYAASSAQVGSRYGAGSTLARQSAQSVRSADGTYKVRPNDSYWEISRKLYGSGAYFKALAEHNRDKVPHENELSVGDDIYAPSVSELEKSYPELCPKPSRREIVKSRASGAGRYQAVSYGGGRRYVVQEGDTLFDIARYELGKASRWVEIHELNRGVLGNDFDYLTPGLELALPTDKKADNVTQRPAPTPGAYYRR